MKKAFTLIETLIVVAVLAIVAVIALPNFLSGSHQSDLNSAAQEIVASARNAQSQATNQTDAAQWGIHFSNTTNPAPFYATFTGSSYSAGTVQDYYRLPASVAFTSSTLPVGSSEDVVFSQVSGKPLVILSNGDQATAASIGIYSVAQPSLSSTIIISGAGNVSSLSGPSTLPWIQSVSPTYGPVGSLVTLTGSNFTASSNVINFSGGVVAYNATSSASGTIMHFVVPGAVSSYCPPGEPVGSGPGECSDVVEQLPIPGSFNISVTNPNGTSNNVIFTITSS